MANFWIDRPGPGRLGTMPRPEGGDRLLAAVEGLRRERVDLLCSALTDSELVALELEKLSLRCAEVGIVLVRLPIPDRHVPLDDALARAVINRLARAVAGGRRVVVHCWAGIGRSSLIAAAVLTRLGLNAAEAFSSISAARGLTVPETSEQRLWVELFASGERIDSVS